MYCRYYHALQLKLVEAAKGSADAEDTEGGDDIDSSDAGEQECKNGNAEDETRTRCGDDDADEEGPGTSSGTSYLGYLVTIKASWFNVAWAKQTHGNDYGMAWYPLTPHPVTTCRNHSP